MPGRKYAKDTTVGVAQTRGETDRLLRDWGATAIQWTDEYEDNRVTLRFAWWYEGTTYMARFAIILEPVKDEDVMDGRTGRVSENKRRKAEAARGKREHRLLLLWIKAALNAVEAGIVDEAAIFLPFLEDSTGTTVAEVAVPKLAQLVSGKAIGLLPTLPTR